MKDAPHIIIIGGGLIGLSTADALSLGGAKVTVIEARDRVMGGASFSNSGMVHLSQAHPWVSVIGVNGLADNAAQSVLALAQYSAPLIMTKSKAMGLSMNHRAPGCLQIFPDVQSWTAAQDRYDGLGINYRRQPAGGVLGDKPALLFPDDTSGNAFDYGLALSKRLLKAGVAIMTGQGATLRLEKGRVIGVSIGDTHIDADHVILAAGADSAAVAAQAKLHLPIKAVAGYALTFLKADNLGLPDIPVMDFATRSCLTVFGNKVRLSGTVDQDSADCLLTIWDDLIPGLRDALGAPITPPWRGERPASLTGKPLIGRTGVPGLWVNTGHAHMGWTLCAGAGAVMADMILGGSECFTGSHTMFSVPALPL